MCIVSTPSICERSKCIISNPDSERIELTTSDHEGGSATNASGPTRSMIDQRLKHTRDAFYDRVRSFDAKESVRVDAIKPRMKNVYRTSIEKKKQDEDPCRSSQIVAYIG